MGYRVVISAFAQLLMTADDLPEGDATRLPWLCVVHLWNGVLVAVLVGVVGGVNGGVGGCWWRCCWGCWLVGVLVVLKLTGLT